jgi:hypothetical protein
VQIDIHSAAALEMGIAGKHGEFSRRVIQVDAQYGETAGGHDALAKIDLDLTDLRAPLHLKVAETAIQVDGGRAAGSAPPQF